MWFLRSAGSSLSRIAAINTHIEANTLNVIGIRAYAARKGTRERRKKQKVKVEVEKVDFVPHNQRNLEQYLLTRPKRKFDDSKLPLPIDNVYTQRYYRWKVYPFVEAVECHRQTHHPEMYNKPNESLQVNIELNMEGEKKTRFMENFTRMAAMPHKFYHGEERTILAFTKTPEMQEEVRMAGAQLVGGLELIKEIQNGTILLQDFQYIVAHPNILPELVPLRGLMKRRFPNPKNGTLEVDLKLAIDRFLNGISYSAVRDEYEKDFGLIQTTIGTLNMDNKELEDNFVSLVQDVQKARPKRSGPFITRCLLLSPPSSEKFKVDHLRIINESDGPIPQEAVAATV